jgi:TonB family protein
LLEDDAMNRAALCFVLAVVSSCFAGDVPERCVLFAAVPSYPPLAQAARIEGIVKIKISINEKGEVVDATALSGHEMLKHAAVENVKAWKFTPAPGAKALELFMTYLYSIEGQEVAMAPRKCAHIKLDLPTRVEITAPPPVIETVPTDTK